MNEWLGAGLGALLLAQRDLIPRESLEKDRTTNLKAHTPAVTCGGRRARKGGVGSKLFATDGSSNRAGVTSSVARRASRGFA